MQVDVGELGENRHVRFDSVVEGTKVVLLVGRMDSIIIEPESNQQ